MKKCETTTSTIRLIVSIPMKNPQLLDLRYNPEKKFSEDAGDLLLKKLNLPMSYVKSSLQYKYMNMEDTIKLHATYCGNVTCMLAGPEELLNVCFDDKKFVEADWLLSRDASRALSVQDAINATTAGVNGALKEQSVVDVAAPDAEEVDCSQSSLITHAGEVPYAGLNPPNQSLTTSSSSSQNDGSYESTKESYKSLRKRLVHKVNFLKELDVFEGYKILCRDIHHKDTGDKEIHYLLFSIILHVVKLNMLIYLHLLLSLKEQLMTHM